MAVGSVFDRDGGGFAGVELVQVPVREGGGKEAKEALDIDVTAFGKTPEGQEVKLYTLHNAKGASAKIMTYGAIVDVAGDAGQPGPDGRCRAGL